ncbi:MAG TPA: amidohydrolase family protein [Acidimicrobiales bacterium]|nr:amidohydrolase family protein [Acidimicrobiales bacterium]
MSDAVEPGTDAWRAQVDEDVVDPDQRVVDAHHHLWPDGEGMGYGVAELLADAGSGHRVERTVFVECRSAYRSDGPEDMRPVGETEFVAGAAARAGGLIGGIVAHADLRLPPGRLDEVLDAHADAGAGLFRGIRHSLSRGDRADGLTIPGRAPAGLADDPAFRSGVARLGERGLTYDTWQYHYQAGELLDLARAVPGTTIVLDHFSTPLGVGRYAGRHDELFGPWREDIAAIAACENVVAKLGGLAMPDNGFGWHRAARPPTSDEFVAAQRRWYEHTIECFGPDRCLFESNFPVDRLSLSYRVLLNGVKKMAAGCSPAERDAIFQGTATRVYRLD